MPVSLPASLQASPQAELQEQVEPQEQPVGLPASPGAQALPGQVERPEWPAFQLAAQPVLPEEPVPVSQPVFRAALAESPAGLQVDDSPAFQV